MNLQDYLIPESHDLRRKISKQTEKDILGYKKDVLAGTMTISDLARMFEVSRRKIQFVLYPERLDACLLARYVRNGDAIYREKIGQKAVEEKRDAYKARKEYLYKKGVLIKK